MTSLGHVITHLVIAQYFGHVARQRSRLAGVSTNEIVGNSGPGFALVELVVEGSRGHTSPRLIGQHDGGSLGERGCLLLFGG